MTRLVPDAAPAAAKLTARAIDRFVGHEMSTYAAALAYRALLSLFPFIIFVIALLNLLDVWRLSTCSSSGRERRRTDGCRPPSGSGW
jgi:hypothetical protein